MLRMFRPFDVVQGRPELVARARIASLHRSSRSRRARGRTAACIEDLSWDGEELSYGHLDWPHNRALALDGAVDSVLHHVHPSREGARTHLVHMVEAAGSPRHWVGP